MKAFFLPLILCVSLPVWAENTFYGKISSGVSVNQTRWHDGSRLSNSQIADFDSYMGIRGRIPLGSSNTRTIWQWEHSTPSSTSLREQWRAKKESSDLSTRADFTR